MKAGKSVSAYSYIYIMPRGEGPWWLFDTVTGNPPMFVVFFRRFFCFSVATSTVKVALLILLIDFGLHCKIRFKHDSIDHGEKVLLSASLKVISRWLLEVV